MGFKNSRQGRAKTDLVFCEYAVTVMGTNPILFGNQALEHLLARGNARTCFWAKKMPTSTVEVGQRECHLHGVSPTPMAMKFTPKNRVYLGADSCLLPPPGPADRGISTQQ